MQKQIKKHIVLCADDYGFDTFVSNGIIKLIEAKKISATSCLVNFTDFKKSATLLRSFINKIDIGLHFNLTDRIENFGSLFAVITKAKLHMLQQNKIVDEFNKQLDIFSNTLGVLPDFIDGHQHIQQLPVVCDAIFSVYEKRLRNKKPYMRYSHIKLNKIFQVEPLKSLLINLTADCKYKEKLQNFSIPYNNSFAGVYDFNQNNLYGSLFPKFLQMIEDNGVIMCHAGLLAKNSLDPLTKNRNQEYNYFLSNKFTADCDKANVVIGRFQK